MRDPKKIVEKLLRQGYTQKDIAQMIEVAESTISRILSGATPRLDTAEALWAIPSQTLRKKKPQ